MHEVRAMVKDLVSINQELRNLACFLLLVFILLPINQEICAYCITNNLGLSYPSIQN